MLRRMILVSVLVLLAGFGLGTIKFEVARGFQCGAGQTSPGHARPGATLRVGLSVEPAQRGTLTVHRVSAASLGVDAQGDGVVMRADARRGMFRVSCTAEGERLVELNLIGKVTPSIRVTSDGPVHVIAHTHGLQVGSGTLGAMPDDSVVVTW